MSRLRIKATPRTIIATFGSPTGSYSVLDCVPSAYARPASIPGFGAVYKLATPSFSIRSSVGEKKSREGRDATFDDVCSDVHDLS